MQSSNLVAADHSVPYVVQESPVLVAALAWVIAVGGVAVAAILICGWRGARSVVLDWMRGRATFYCK